jgi:hypothetical protein
VYELSEAVVELIFKILVSLLPVYKFNDAVVDNIDAVIALRDDMFEVDDVTDDKSIPLYINEPVTAALCICICYERFV